MGEQLAHYLSSVPKEMITFFIAMLPFVELRGAIPWALAGPPMGGGLDWPQAYLLAVIGNLVPVVPLLLYLEPVSNSLRRYRFLDAFFNWLFNRTRKKGRIVERYEAVGLALFVGIPLPVTGAWTGTVAAFVFGIRFCYALPAILVGIMLSGTLVTLASLGILSLW